MVSLDDVVAAIAVITPQRRNSSTISIRVNRAKQNKTKIPLGIVARSYFSINIQYERMHDDYKVTQQQQQQQQQQ